MIIAAAVPAQTDDQQCYEHGGSSCSTQTWGMLRLRLKEACKLLTVLCLKALIVPVLGSSLMRFWSDSPYGCWITLIQ